MPLPHVNIWPRRTHRFAPAILILAASLASLSAIAAPLRPQSAPAQETAHRQPGVPLRPEALSSMLPPSVYFQGRTAPLQVRNAAAVPFGNGAVVWAALVDSSGYATSMQQKYQFYLVTECPLHFGNAQLPAGVYGGGFLGDRFILMDVGGHTVAQGPTQLDSAYPRPRPLQMIPVSATAVKLMLGRHWVQLEAASAP